MNTQKHHETRRPGTSRLGAAWRGLCLSSVFLLGMGTSEAVLPEVLFTAKSGDITTDPLVWPTDDPVSALTNIGSPSASTINGKRWALNFRDTSTGFQFPGPGAAFAEGWWPAGSFDSIPINGASIVVAVRPIRNTIADGWNSVVDIFYQRLVLVVRNNNGEVGVWRNGGVFYGSGHFLPNGQITVLSVVVQPTGEFRTFANGTEIMNVTDTSPMTELTAGPEWFKHYINVGRNQPDGWPAFNGNIGDVLVYKGALEDADRETLETELTTKFGTAEVYTVTTTAGTGGSISPAGFVDVPQNTDQTFTISTDYGYVLADVVVDTVSQGPITSYTFTDVTADHTIEATWTGLPTISGTVTDSATTDPIYSAMVSLSSNPDGSAPSITVATNDLGEYEIAPADANITYYLVARKGGHVTSAVKTVAMSGSSVSGQDFVLVKSAGLDPLVVLDADTLPSGPLTSWPNTGSLGGSFESFNEASTPTVGASVGGKKAVEFMQPGIAAEWWNTERQTLVGTVPTPPEIAGDSDWTLSTVLYRQDGNVNSENCYMCWSGRDINGWPASQYRTAQFTYRDNLAAVHYGADYGFDLGTPPGGEWHNVTITYDGFVETLYVDGVFQQTRNWVLDLKANTMMMVGGAYWDGNNNGFNRGEDQYWRFNGAIASLQIFDQALTAEEVESISGISDPSDTDADGLADSWELGQVGNLTDLTGLKDGPGPGADTGDFDGDGTSDFAELRLGLIPNNGTSTFAATIVRNIDGAAVLSWPSQTGLVFDILWTDDLSGSFEKIGTKTDTDGGGTESFTDPAAALDVAGYYRVMLLP